MTTSRKIGLYLHIPFCRQRCHFCAFYLEVTRSGRIEAFCSALAQEIEIYGRQDLVGNRPLCSVYFGGGTPTAIPTKHLISLLDLIRSTWPLAPDGEVTVEAHPSTVTRKDLHDLAEAGITRISFGAESMNDSDFDPIGRPGNVRDTETAVSNAWAEGFTNINLDLMYGLPGQSVEAWASTLYALCALNPTHVSCYALTVEKGTKLAQDIAQQLVPQPDDGVQLQMEATAQRILGESGFDRYEISNYAKPGAVCRHNLLYWTDQDYLGLGPSAQSYVDGSRFGNLADLTAYVDSLASSRLPISEHIALTTAERQRDALVFGLRLIKGVPKNLLHHQRQHMQVQDLVAQGLLTADSERIRLTAFGQRYADTVAEQLFCS